MKYTTAGGATLALLLVSAGASAELYQWLDPASHIRQLSGTPPAWYRGDAPGPRVKVFAHGRLIDDTSIAVSDEEAALLRNRAFGTPAAGVVAPAAVKHSEETVPTVVLPPRPPPPATTATPATTAADLKALIEAWDKNREAQARAVLRDKLAPAPPAADAARP